MLGSYAFSLICSLAAVGLSVLSAAMVAGEEPSINLVQTGCALVSPDDAGKNCDDACSMSQQVVIKTCLGEETISVLPRDEVWLVSVRQDCCGTKGCDDCQSTARYDFEAQRLIKGQWVPADLAGLVANHQSSDGLQTVVMVHGNNTDRRWAITRGMQFYDRLIGRVTACRPSVRMVILDWDSEQVCLRPLQDFKLKAARAAALGLPVAFLLEELDGPRPLLAGYSLGVQVILATVDRLSENANRSCHCGGYRMALIAPALDPDYACNDLAVIEQNSLIAEAELFCNTGDRLVRVSELISRKQNVDAAVEPSISRLFRSGSLDSTRFQRYDVAREVRNRHSLINYLASPKLKCKMLDLLRATASDNAIVESSKSFVENDTCGQPVAAAR
jgi:hypothetical protein